MPKEPALRDPFAPEALVPVETQSTLPVASAVSNPFVAPKRNGYYLPHSPREIRCMCEKSKGYFADANDTNLGTEYKFRVLNWREVHGVKFSAEYPEPETVIQCIVVDDKKIINQMVFRTYSMGNFMNCLSEIDIQGVPLAQAVITAKMEKYTGKKSGFTYHLVKFGFTVDETSKELDELRDFVVDNPNVMHSFKELPTVA